MRPWAIPLGVLLLIVSCTPTQTEDGVRSEAATPSAVACPSVASNEGADPQPIAPPDDTTTLAIAGRIDLPAESALLGSTDDAVWATSPAGFLWRIEAAPGVITHTVDLPDLGLARPAAGFDSLWVAEMKSGRVLRIDPVTVVVEAEIPLEPSDRPMALAFDADHVFVANQTRNSVTVIDPTTNTVRRSIDLSDGAPGSSDRAPSSVATGAGIAWVVEHRADALASVHVSSGVAGRSCVGSPNPGAVALAGGALWVADAGAVVSVIDPADGSALVRLGLPSVTAGDLTADHRTLWIGGGSAVVGIDLESKSVSGVAPTGELSDTRAFAGGVALAGTTDSIWTTDPAGNGLLRISKPAVGD